MQSEKRLRDDSEESRTDEYFDGALESTAHQEDETYSSQFMSILGLKADPLEDSKSRLIEEHDSFAQDGSDSSRIKSQDKTAVRELKPIDHASMVYRELRKNIYYPAPEIASLSEAEVDEIRKQADNTKVKGRDVPNPIETWSQCGFDSTIISELMRRNFSVPFPIQKQCIPILLSGRDVLAIAQTGSGKTLAYVLPLIRHVLCQPPVQSREGPIAVVLLCTRELAIQVGHTISAYVQVLTANNIRVGIFYGGSPISENIAVCKSDIQIAVTTPGRWYDLLTANRGRVTNLTRVSFIIIDEADRMFDDGFFPQITKILRNVRPDKQIGMFTATLPAFICKMATQMLVDPIVVKIGSRLSVAKNVKQTVEIFKQKQHRFLRLLQILGQWDESLTLIFTETKNEADELFMRLKELQYNSCLLHSGMDQIDRQFSLYEFRSTRKNIMVATGVAARGIDVLNLDLVINFTTPRSYEEYIHRVGRTGRAGKMGTAFTLMLIPEDDKFASYLVQTLDSSENPIPDELQELASLQMKCKDKNALVLRQSHTNTYSGRGFRFDAKEAHETKKRRREAQREQMKLMNLEYSDSTSQDESEDATLDQYFRDQSNQEYDSKDAHNVIQDVIHKTGKEIALKSGDVTSRALALVDALNAVKDREDELAARGIFVREIDVNDLSARIRSKVCKRDNLSDIMRETKTVISIRGEYIPSNMKKMRPGTKRMRLHIEGSDEQGIREAQEKIYAFIANEENIIQANVRL